MTSTSAKPSIKLTYFDIAGRAEPIRLALVLSNTPFDDERLSREEWQSFKPKTPYGQLPVMTIDNGEPMAQSMALLRYVGATFSDTLYPREHLYEIEEAMNILDDFWTYWAPCMFIGMSPQSFGYPEGFAQTDEGKEKIKQMRTKWLETVLPEHANHMSRLIEKHGGVWMASKEHPTVADCMAYATLDAFTRGYIDHVPTDCWDKYPAIKAYLERFKELPEVKECLSSESTI
ncbi:hypothetical protein MPSEU_000620400 [Mayamaea pseudoterrestris]|nr:hypothetical protein MPSEU_000620400 [Mayamaea pseudoterrestris]